MRLKLLNNLSAPKRLVNNKNTFNPPQNNSQPQPIDLQHKTDFNDTHTIPFLNETDIY